MSKRKAGANNVLWKACAISLGIFAFANAATAEYANSADVYGYPFGLKTTLDHQVKEWGSGAMPDSQDSIFMYAEATAEPQEVETVLAAPAAPLIAQGPFAPMPQAAPLPEKVITTAAAPVPAPAPPKSTVASAPASGDALSREDRATLISDILQQYASKGINADAAMALLTQVLNARNDLPKARSPSVLVSPPVALAAAPAPIRTLPTAVTVPVAVAAQSWAIKPNSTVQETLAAWTRIAGWKAPKWEAENPYRIVGGAPITGSFFDALRVLADALPQLDFVASVDRRELVISDSQH